MKYTDVKVGDIIRVNFDGNRHWIGIVTEIKGIGNDCFKCSFGLDANGYLLLDNTFGCHCTDTICMASDEDKKALFDAMKRCGYEVVEKKIEVVERIIEKRKVLADVLPMLDMLSYKELLIVNQKIANMLMPE